jgi:hypothetical protein
MHGFALLTRYFRTHSQRDLSNAIGRLEEARRAVEQQVGSPYTAAVLLILAMAYRARGDAARGDVDRAVTYGLAGLREQAGDVLLQDNDDQALHVARRGRDDATEMARWFLGHGREAAAISALELGRNMVLHSATSSGRAGETLSRAGRADLADRWASRPVSGGKDFDADADLRYQAFLAIEQSPAVALLLSPPTVGDIAAALARSEADALVYLLPKNDSSHAMAVLVDQARDVRILPLPRLPANDQGPVADFIRARREADQERRLRSAAAYPATRAWEEALNGLCGWAWQAVVGPVLAAIPEYTGRERRIVIIPDGQLGLVPWHAAREPGTGRYACERAVFSYASSAQQFIDATQCRPRRWGQAPVLISSPELSSWHILAGIRYLFDAYYPAATVFGGAREVGAALPYTVPGGLTVTPADVLSALPSASGPGASLLHLGLGEHSETGALPPPLFLGARQSLAIQEILDQGLAWRSGPHAQRDACGLVILMSCPPAGADYDKALTQATALLSAGAAGVIAPQWELADVSTALLMCTFHRFLNAGLDPARALREAQLWMLDPRRTTDGLPRILADEAELSGEPDGGDLASTAAWAAFEYWGR